MTTFDDGGITLEQVEEYLENPVARAVLFFLVPVAVTTGISVGFGWNLQQGIFYGVAFGVIFAIYGVSFVTPASDGE